MREISFEWNGKILVLSDIHYPKCNIDEINKVIDSEKPSLIILLGDIITEGWEESYREFISKLKMKRNIIYVRGDEDKLKGDFDVIKIKTYGKSYILLHGHQYFNEKQEYSLAKLLKKINQKLPPLLFCLMFRLVLHDFRDVLILGHSHALVHFKSVKCVNAGTMSDVTNNIYNDKGYVIIDEEGVKTFKIV
ncbi:metal-dependent phosphodiesterase [Sulfolobus sp. A20]|uniref:metallophosphoesterase family protein n=1 Tax=Sulfolobaceae TaxID=118883 RepID=UPI0008460638|nr:MULTISPECIES: metallophosphoesterase family protein [unclassified Sulfolobus]TRM79423.1 metallophosphoesterase [Sulfolobus sp. B5]TRM81260.1 metallophosphoesterase [Sulfolobus sp. D5]TRM83245.1 metallophosphoesterase [Sulfolobus sp. A20-N-F6]TRM83672.1 metallophosphoesterase [Sulfolobus sp. F3]TRM87705.1 metallophosphoesterase [Sulfolobus sp. E3]TRM94820.1 metallophosphoesterase [Sulfolobus sp. A20-N-G8]TRN00043.1 metallophosphoesterase [Sulfolobus sp. F1]TRN03168.1 metallophosphoesteras